MWTAVIGGGSGMCGAAGAVTNREEGMSSVIHGFGTTRRMDQRDMNRLIAMHRNGSGKWKVCRRILSSDQAAGSPADSMLTRD